MTTNTSTHSPITDDQKQLFLEEGFLRIDNVLEPEDLAWYRDIYNEIFDPNNQKVRRKQLGGTDEQGRETLPQVGKPSELFPELKERRYFQRLTQIAQFILGPEARFERDHMIFKPAGFGVATPWHQDQAYGDTASRHTNINFWTPLQDVTVEGGCMQYVRHTHRGTIVPHQFLIPGDPQSALCATDQAYWQANATPLPCRVGGVCLHHSYCMHYAGPNTTQVPRRAYIAIFGIPATKLPQPFIFPWKDDPAYRTSA